MATPNSRTQGHEMGHFSVQSSPPNVVLLSNPFSKPARDFMNRFASIILFLGTIYPVNAALDMGRCCQIRARGLLKELDDKPWTVCGIGKAISDPLTDISSLDEWLEPLAQWLVPYLTLLLLCPIGENAEEGERKDPRSKWRKILDWMTLNLCKVIPDNDGVKDVEKDNFADKVREWIILLGDPATALWGAFSQLSMDFWVARRLWRIEGLPEVHYSVHGHEKEMLGLAIMASQTPMDRGNAEILTNEFIIKALKAIPEAARSARRLGDEVPRSITDLQNALVAAEETGGQNLFQTTEQSRSFAKAIGTSFVPAQTIRDCLTSLKNTLGTWAAPDTTGSIAGSLQSAIDGVLEDSNPHIDQPFHFSESDFTKKLDAGIRTILDARINFLNGIVLPVVFHFVTTAWGFYKAYQKLGDNDTSHNLAYGALYSWLIILVVVGNSFAASVNVKVVKATIKQFTLKGIRVPLRRRYTNALEWKYWLTDVGVPTGLTSRAETTTVDGKTINATFGWRFYAKYLFGLAIGWACIAFFGSCAIVISYTTPTVGWGCRSFNHLLYIIFSLLAAWAQVLRYFVESKYDTRVGANSRKTSFLGIITRWLYGLIVSINAFILVGGTIFHFCGLYRSYYCDAIFGPSDAVVQLASHTSLHVHNALAYWYSTGYVAYCVAWIICAIAVVYRKYIQMALHTRFDRNANQTAGDAIASLENNNKRKIMEEGETSKSGVIADEKAVNPGDTIQG